MLKTKLTDASFHGLSHMFKTNRVFTRLVWFVVFLISFSGCSYTIYNSVVDYLNFDMITIAKSIRSTSEIFPAVTVCRDNDVNLADVTMCIFYRQDSGSFDCRGFLEKIDVISKLEGKKTTYCFRFNSNMNASMLKSVAGVGRENGLEIHMNKFSSLDYSRAHVYVTDNYLNDYSGINPTIVAASYETELQVTKNVARDLPKPYNDCQENKKATYRKLNCVAACNQDMVNSRFNCSLQGYYENKSLARCTKSNQQTMFLNECGAKCAQECVVTTYSVKETRDLRTSFTTINVFSKSFQIPVYNVTDYVIKVYYTSLDYIEASQVAKTSQSDLVSLVGGTLGLFLGASFLSFFEFFELLSEVVFFCLMRN